MREWVIETAIKIYTFLLPVSWIALAVVVLVLLPMAAWRRTRGAAGTGLLIAAFIFATTTWSLAAAITFGSFGWLGLIIGLLVFGVGVVPLGIIGAFFKLDIIGLGVSLCVMLVITLTAQIAGAYLRNKGDT